ncbi:MAG: RNA methyltransferase [bacterium]|nr:RNA methyltransferase [bacterium]
MTVRIESADDPRVVEYTGLTDVALRRRIEPEHGIYLAESSNVIRRAVEAGHQVRSFLMAPRWLDSMADVIEEVRAGGADVPVYVAPEDLLRQITGFHLHRGAIASMNRPPLLSVEEVLAGARGGEGARRVLVLEDIVDHTNVGAAIRSAAALGVDAVLVTPRCSDPLYRRAVRVSMGTVFQLPWTRIDPWPAGIDVLRSLGFTVAALALSDDSVSLDELAASPPEKLALVLGTEGDGLSHRTVVSADVVVRIPMDHGVDSLNVAAAGAVAFYATRLPTP